jgi:hypothetical protein
MNTCEYCNAMHFGTGVRWLVLEETQRCIWESPTCVPEVDIDGSFVLNICCSGQHAMRKVDEYLSRAGAKALWSDVRPIETCTCCEEDFDTTTWHRVLTLSVEMGTLAEPKILDGWYVARFCQQCVPCVGVTQGLQS